MIRSHTELEVYQMAYEAAMQIFAISKGVSPQGDLRHSSEILIHKGTRRNTRFFSGLRVYLCGFVDHVNS
jgi:hypothetical protein